MLHANNRGANQQSIYGQVCLFALVISSHVRHTGLKQYLAGGKVSWTRNTVPPLSLATSNPSFPSNTLPLLICQVIVLCILKTTTKSIKLSCEEEKSFRQICDYDQEIPRSQTRSQQEEVSENVDSLPPGNTGA